MKLYSQSGFTLVELIVSSSLGLLLALAVGTLYLSNKHTFRTGSQLAQLQGNGEFASYFLSKDIRMAGYYGCPSDSEVPITNWINTPPLTLSDTNDILGYSRLNDGTFNPALPASITGTPVNDSDVLAIHTTSSDTLFLNADMVTTSDNLSLNNTLNIAEGNAVLITNCVAADLFIASTGTGNNTITHSTDYNTSAALTTPYKANSEVLPYNFYAYYVQDTGRTNESNQPIYALVREDTNHQIDEITEGVEKMKISYLVDSDAIPGPNAYQTAQEVTNNNNWGNVVALQISLLLSTVEEASNAQQNYYFNGNMVAPTNRKLHLQRDVFINLRSRGA